MTPASSKALGRASSRKRSHLSRAGATARHSRQAWRLDHLDANRCLSIKLAASALGLRLHGISENSDLVDFNRDDVARGEPARRDRGHSNSVGGSGQYYRASKQRCAAAQKFNQRGNIKDHVARIAVLNRFSVENRPNREGMGVGDLIGSDEMGPERTEGIERFAATPLTATFLFLPITRADIIGAGIAQDETQGISPGYVLASFLDHDGEFAFVVDLSARPDE